MNDDENKTSDQLATEITTPQAEQVDVTGPTSDSPASAPATSEELILGKFKSQEDLIASYQELERNYTASRQAPRTPAPKPVVPQTELFDSETLQGIKAVTRAELEAERAEAFARAHKDELADPLLRGAVRIEIEDANARGEYMDQETALRNAKAALERRLAPKVETAAKESFEEGKNLARRKEQAGAIGSTNAPKSDVNPDELSADDYAAYHNLERTF